MVRLAKGNFCPLHTFYSALLGQTPLWNRDLDFSVTSSTLKLLADKIQIVDHVTLNDMTLRSFEGSVTNLFSGKGSCVSIMPLGIYHRLRTSYGLQYCPLCLAEDDDPYFRKSWRLVCQFCCTKHGCYLNHKCHKCNSPVVFHRVPLEYLSIRYCYKCSADLADSTRINVCKHLLNVQEKINLLIEERWYALTPSDHVAAPLIFEGVYQLAKLYVKNQALFSPFVTTDNEPLSSHIESKKHLERLFCPKLRGSAMCFAFYLLDDWPTNFVECFKTVQWSFSKIRKSKTHLPYWFECILLDEFYEGMPKHRTNPLWGNYM